MSKGKEVYTYKNLNLYLTLRFFLQFPISGIKNHFEMAKRMTGVRYELPVNYNFSPKVRHLVKLVSFKI